MMVWKPTTNCAGCNTKPCDDCNPFPIFKGYRPQCYFKTEVKLPPEINELARIVFGVPKQYVTWTTT